MFRPPPISAINDRDHNNITLQLNEIAGSSFREHTSTVLPFQDNADILLLVVDDLLDPRIKELGETYYQQGLTWMLISPYHSQVLLSPIMTAGDTACWHCIHYRLRLHRPLNSLKNHDAKLLKLSNPIFDTNNTNKISRLITERINRYHQNSLNSVYKSSLISFDAKTNSSRHHHVDRRPQCKLCGNPTQKTDYREVTELTVTKQKNHQIGGYRSLPAEQTYKKYQHLVSPVTGIIPDIKEYRSIDSEFIFNYSSGRNLALQSQSMFWLNNHLRSSSGGKGRTQQQAKTGALCEAIERYSMVFHGQLTCLRSCYDNIIDEAIHPNNCMNFSSDQIKNREKINQKTSSFHSLIPIQFNQQEELDWTSVYSLVDKRIRYLPSAFCYAQHPERNDETQLIAYPDSNGCSAGNSHAEAILQGSLELIERDAAAIWWYNRLQRPYIDLSDLNNEYIDELINYYHTIGRSLYVLDITTDLKIPCFVAISYNLSSGKQILYGFGCHIDAELAVERAIIELNQLLPIAMTKRPSNLDSNLANWLDSYSVESNSYILPEPDKTLKVADLYSKPEKPDINLAIQHLIQTFKQHGIDLLILDLTQIDIGLPVVRMFAPGLRHFWRRLGPGRLYDVPIKMQWRETKLEEQEMNPLSIVI